MVKDNDKQKELYLKWINLCKSIFSLSLICTNRPCFISKTELDAFKCKATNLIRGLEQVTDEIYNFLEAIIDSTKK